MSIIIRLQHLPVTAKSTDIRKYFFGLRIPEGGVHIVGGLTGDAFIAFATDEDARQAILLNHGLIHNNRINLLLSSKTEMNAVIASAKKAEANNKSITSHQQQYLSSSPPSKRICPSTFESNNRSSIYPTASDQQSSISLPIVPASSSRSSNDSWMRNESWKTDQTRDNPARYNNYATRTTPPPSSWNNDRSSSSQCPSTTTIDRAYPIMHAAPDLQHYPSSSSSFDPTVMQQHNDKAINQSTMIIDSVHHHAPIGRRHRPSLLPEPISTTLPPAPIVGPAYSNDSCCIELRRLPVDLLRPIALEQFLRPSVPLTLSSIKAVFDPQGFHLYSMVRFANVNDANDAIARDGEQGIRIRQCTISDFDRQPHSLIPASVAAAAAAPHKSSSVSSAPSLAINERYCLELSNVPIRADEHDILNFLGIVPMKMFKTCNRQDDSRWIVQFDSLTKAEQIAQMQRDIAGNRIYIARITNETADRQEIEIANRKHDNIPTQIVADDQKNKKEEEEEKKDRVVQLADESRVVGFFNRSSTNDLSSFDRTPPVDPYHSTATKDNHHHQDSTESIARHNKLQSNQSESSSCYLRLTNVPANVSDRDVIRFLDANVVNNGVHNMHNGSVYVQVCSDIDSYRAIRHNRSYLGANCILISAITQEAFNASIRGSTIIDPEVVQSIGKPGSVIAVRGLPADVTLDDLITFFDRYQLVQDSVRMHFDDNGTPSGDCLLALSSCTEANKAVQSLNGRRLHRSVVTLSIVEI